MCCALQKSRWAFHVPEQGWHKEKYEQFKQDPAVYLKELKEKVEKELQIQGDKGSERQLISRRHREDQEVIVKDKVRRSRKKITTNARSWSF